MLLIDDDDLLPAAPTPLERAFVAVLDEEERRAIDARIRIASRRHWLKVARVVFDVLELGGYDPWDDAVLYARVRAVIARVEAGELEADGDLRRPRFSEVRIAPSMPA